MRLCLVYLLSAGCFLAFGQTATTQFSGTVTDSSSSTIPGAQVTATNEATGLLYSQSTTGAGLYAFPSIPVGSYTLIVEKTGFKRFSLSKIVLQINTPATVNATLEVGSAAETVSVEATADVLQTTNATLGNVVEHKAIEALPLNGRNPLNLLIYEPGVVQRSGNTITVNGSRTGAVNVTVDGIEANESTNPNPTNNIFRLNPDNVQEFKVTTSNPSAEEGRNSGANVSIATRSGTNQFHGTAFEFFRNTALNANEFYAKAQGLGKPVIQLNQYGLEVGGPIRKNKTFFFGSWQGQKVNFADPVDKAFGKTVDLYSKSALTGLFRYFVVDPRTPFTLNGQRITQNTPLLVNRATGQLADGVRACGAAGDTNCVATYDIFQNDPLRRGLDPAVKSVLGGYPAPNQYSGGDGLNTGNYAYNTPFQIRGPQYLARLDHVISEKHNLFGRFLGAEQNTLGGDPLNGRPQVLPGYPARGEVFRPAYNIAIGLRSVLSPRLVNEFTVGYSRFNFLFTQGEAIGIDILIDQPQPEDGELIATLRAMRTPTALAFATSATNEQAILYWQEAFLRRFQASLAGGATRAASVLIQPDADGVVRSWPGRPDTLPPVLADRLVASPRPPGAFTHSIGFRLPRASDRPVFASLPIDLFENAVSAPLLRDQIAGRIVLIGGDITNADQFDTPLTRLDGHPMIGLAIHAAMVAQRLDGHSPAPMSWGLKLVMALLVVAIGVAAGAAEVSGWQAAAATAVPLAVIIALPVGLQAAGMDTAGLPALGWVIGWLLAYSAAAAVARGLASEQRRFAQNALGRYLPRDVAQAILRDPGQLSLSGERRTIFALFSDLEGFTKLTHAVAPETLAMLLNRYLDMLSSVVLAHGGTIDKFVGDAVVAFWGAPIARDDDGDRALSAAMAMAAAGETFRREAPADVPPIGRTRIGLHRGEVIVGNFGGEGRIQYTALGDAMNTASRLEGANKKLGTTALVSAEAAAAMTDPPLRPMGRVTVRGRSTPVVVFEPIAGLTPADAATLTAIIARFDAGDAAALDELDAYAAGRPGDTALIQLRRHLETAGPGGSYALD